MRSCPGNTLTWHGSLGGRDKAHLISMRMQDTLREWGCKHHLDTYLSWHYETNFSRLLIYLARGNILPEGKYEKKLNLDAFSLHWLNGERKWWREPPKWSVINSCNQHIEETHSTKSLTRARSCSSSTAKAATGSLMSASGFSFGFRFTPSTTPALKLCWGTSSGQVHEEQCSSFNRVQLLLSLMPCFSLNFPHPRTGPSLCLWALRSYWNPSVVYRDSGLRKIIGQSIIMLLLYYFL